MKMTSKLLLKKKVLKIMELLKNMSKESFLEKYTLFHYFKLSIKKNLKKNLTIC